MARKKQPPVQPVHEPDGSMDKLEGIIGHKFRDREMLKKALTHSSYANENKEEGTSNERLEFFGDSVLGLLTSEYIYKHFTELSEGNLTKVRAAVVCEEALYEIACEIGLGEYLLLGKGELANGGKERPSILADSVEALLAAIYLDGGYRAALKFFKKYIPKKISKVSVGSAYHDYKTLLQEIVQKNHQETLKYKLVEEAGPDHDKRFTVDVYLNSNAVARGAGKSKKEAEQAAAHEALVLMGEE